jgi:hypothetical protein
VSVPQINLDIDTRFTSSSVISALDHQKYPVDDINELTPYTLLYIRVRTLKTIEVTNAIAMATRIMHGRPVPSECVVVKVTTIREGRKFKDLDYPDEVEGIEKLKNAKGNFNTSNFDLHVELAELHTMFHLKMIDITMMTAWCM